VRSSWTRGAAALLVVGLVGALGMPAAFAQAPANDTEGSAVEVGALPFTHTEDTSEATPDGPRFCTNNASVFFTYTPSSDTRVLVDTIGSDYDTVVSVYRRQASGIRQVDCNDDRFGLASGLRFRAAAGVTYVIMVGQCCGSGRRGGGELTLTVTESSQAELAFSVDVDASGTADPMTGLATLTGTATCNERAIVYREGLLRQVRQGLFVARGFWSVEIGCLPGQTVAWSAEVDTETGIAFGSGPAVIRGSFTAATDGFRDFITATPDDLTIQLA
jgi:hypothetical protein